VSTPIGRLFGVFLVMFAFLIVWTSRWTVFDASSLDHNSLNKLPIYAAWKIKEGRILADNGDVLARSVHARGGTWRRVYPTGSLFSQAVGYANPEQGQYSGLEQSQLSWLKGTNQGLSSVFGQSAGQQIGDDVHTTLDPRGQAAARTALAGQAGSVVALQPRTGNVLVMYSNPSYNDNQGPSACARTSGCSLVNTAVNAKDPPGSTFKIVTGTAAINSGKYTPDSMINGHSPIIVSGVPLSNDAGEEYGLVTLTEAFTYSINTVFAQVAENVGIPLMTEYMKRFGFYKTPPIDLPADEMSASRPFDPNGRPYAAGSPNEDIGRIGIGQGGLGVTPLQMAMVVAAVANGGRLMTPHLVTQVVNSDGQTVHTVPPTVLRTVMTPQTAAELTQMMLKVVEEGTGTPAQIGNLQVAGKTGTAQVGPPGSNITEPWFVAFAPVHDPQVAVAVTVQRTNGGYGATVAAPIAKQVMQTLLAEGK
jgi:peptidoglycan glycosyltransferase